MSWEEFEVERSCPYEGQQKVSMGEWSTQFGPPDEGIYYLTTNEYNILSSFLLVQINNNRERQHCALQSFRLPMFAQLHRMPIVHYTNLIALDVPFISLLSPHASSLNSCHIQLEPNF